MLLKKSILYIFIGTLILGGCDAQSSLQMENKPKEIRVTVCDESVDDEREGFIETNGMVTANASTIFSGPFKGIYRTELDGKGLSLSPKDTNSIILRKKFMQISNHGSYDFPRVRYVESVRQNVSD